MQECKKVRDQLLGKKVAEALKTRNMDAWYVDTKEEALEKALSLIPEGSSISWGGSMSVKEIGLLDALKANDKMLVYDRDIAQTPEERQQIMRQAFFCDYFLASSNAVSGGHCLRPRPCADGGGHQQGGQDSGGCPGPGPKSGGPLQRPAV